MVRLSHKTIRHVTLAGSGLRVRLQLRGEGFFAANLIEFSHVVHYSRRAVWKTGWMNFENIESG